MYFPFVCEATFHFLLASGPAFVQNQPRYKMEMEEHPHHDKVEDGAFEALGYEKSYRRVMKTTINLCLVITIES